MNKQDLLRALQTEINRHDFDTFVDNPPSVAQRGKGVVVPGRTVCRKRFNISGQFADDIANDVVPKLLNKLLSTSNS